MSSSVQIRGDLALGQRKLREIFSGSLLFTRQAGELLPGNKIYYLQTGWACQVRDLPNGCRVIVDLYLPGDIIGLQTALLTRPPEEVLTLTAITMGALAAEDALLDLMAYRPTALYAAWLLSQRLRRADRFRCDLKPRCGRSSSGDGA